MQRPREHRQTTPRPRGGVTVVEIDMQRLRQLVEQQPDATVRERHERLDIDGSQSSNRVEMWVIESPSARRARGRPPAVEPLERVFLDENRPILGPQQRFPIVKRSARRLQPRDLSTRTGDVGPSLNREWGATAAAEPG